MTGSTGAIFGVRFLEALKDADVESHLVISKWAQRTIEHETNYNVEQVRELATVVHSQGDMGATISSGCFLTEGRSSFLARCATGRHRQRLRRASRAPRRRRGAQGARKLVLVVRETPLSEVHLENMLKLSRMGVTMLPPMPAFYNHPQSVDDVVNHIVGRVLDQFGIPAPFENVGTVTCIPPPSSRRWVAREERDLKTTSVVAPVNAMTRAARGWSACPKRLPPLPWPLLP